MKFKKTILQPKTANKLEQLIKESRDNLFVSGISLDKRRTELLLVLKYISGQEQYAFSYLAKDSNKGHSEVIKFLLLMDDMELSQESYINHGFDILKESLTDPNFLALAYSSAKIIETYSCSVKVTHPIGKFVGELLTLLNKGSKQMIEMD